VNAQIAAILQPDRLLQDVVDLTKERFRLYHAHIYLLDEAGQTLALTAGAGYVGRQMVTEKRTIDMLNQQSIVARAARSRKGVIVNDVTQSATFLPHRLLPDTQSELAVPLVARGQLLGVLDVQSDQANYFTDEVLSILDLMAGQIAIAVSNALLYDVAERNSRHERALGNIDRQIQGAVDMDEILQVAARELGKALRVPHTQIELHLPTQPETAANPHNNPELASQEPN
jgi:GAF domain-containing protein